MHGYINQDTHCRVEGVAQLAVSLPRMHEILGAIPGTELKTRHAAHAHESGT